MVTKIIIDLLNSDDIKFDNVVSNLEDYYESFGVDIQDMIISETDSDSMLESLYLFSGSSELSVFENALLKNEINIHKKLDFTNDLKSIILNNEIEDFKNRFITFDSLDELVDNFIKGYLTKDDILDKVITFGRESLTDTEIDILEG